MRRWVSENIELFRDIVVLVVMADVAYMIGLSVFGVNR